MTYPLITVLAVEGATIRVPVIVSCRVLGVSRQAYYAWRADPVSQRDWDDAHLINAARDVHADDPEFGYRLISDELVEQGFTASENRVWRVCSMTGIFSVLSPKRRGGKRPGPAVYDDLVERDFTADRPNQLWLTDITEHSTGEGKAVPVRRQGRLLRADRGLQHRLADEGIFGGGRAAQRGRPARRPQRGHRVHRAQRPRQPIPSPEVHPCPGRRWAGRLDGAGGLER